MKRFLFVTALSAAALLAQSESGSKITVPLHDPSRPAQIRAHLMSGGLTITGYDGKDVIIDTHGGRVRHSRHSEEESEAPQGMHKLEIPGSMGFDAVEENNVVTIKSTSWNGDGALNIMVPRRSSLQLKCINNGDIEVTGVDGEIDAENLNGRILLNNVSGSVVAHSLNGEVKATLDRVDPNKGMSFSTMNGVVDVTLPKDVKANLRMKTDNGDIYSDFDVKLNADRSAQAETSGRPGDGRYQVRIDKTLRGTVNGGGPEIQLISFNGQIYLRQKK
jgi:hypothetical protein